MTSLSPSPTTATHSLGLKPSALYLERSGSLLRYVVKLGMLGSLGMVSSLSPSPATPSLGQPPSATHLEESGSSWRNVIKLGPCYPPKLIFGLHHGSVRAGGG